MHSHIVGRPAPKFPGPVITGQIKKALMTDLLNPAMGTLWSLFGVRFPCLIWQLGQYQDTLLWVSQDIGVALSVQLSRVGVDYGVTGVPVQVVGTFFHP